MKLFILLLSLAMYALVIAFPHRKSLVSLGAAAMAVLAGIIFPGQGGITPLMVVAELINWNVLMIYVGSLIIAELFIYSRLPAVLADKAVEKAPSLGIAIVTILVMTGFLSAFVENVATVLVMAPIALEICRRLKIDPTPFMIGLAVMANLQGTATLVGDPPAMIFASYAGYNFNDFFFYAGKPSIFFAVQAGALAGALFFYAYFRKLPKLRVDLPDEKVKSLVPALLLVAMIVGLAAISFFSGHGMHLSSGFLCMGLGIAGLIWYAFLRKEGFRKGVELIKGLDWDTIGFLVGIFVVIGAIGSAGLIEDLSLVLEGLIGGSAVLGFLVIVAVSVLVSGFVDNVPYIIAMLPVADRLARSLSLEPELYMFGLLLGSCLGGNLTPFGASANVVAIGLLKKEGRKTGFMAWLKIGLPFTLLTTLVAAAFVFLVWR